jgi:hypothetical protein
MPRTLMQSVVSLLQNWCPYRDQHLSAVNADCITGKGQGRCVRPASTLPLAIGSQTRGGIAPGSANSLALRYSTVVPKLAMPTPDGIAFLVTEDEGVGTLQDFAGEDEVSFALLDF